MCFEKSQFVTQSPQFKPSKSNTSSWVLNFPACQVEDQVHQEVAECLSIGLSVFYSQAVDRVSVLADLVEGCLKSRPNINPLRLLLASRYFAALTKPGNLIGLAPALIEIFKEGKFVSFF